MSGRKTAKTARSYLFSTGGQQIPHFAWIWEDELWSCARCKRATCVAKSIFEERNNREQNQEIRFTQFLFFFQRMTNTMTLFLSRVLSCLICNKVWFYFYTSTSSDKIIVLGNGLFTVLPQKKLSILSTSQNYSKKIVQAPKWCLHVLFELYRQDVHWGADRGYKLYVWGLQSSY